MEENQIIVDVGLDAFIESLRHLQKQYELNTAALKAMKDAGEEQSDAYITLTQEQKVLRQQISSTEKAMQNEIKMQQAQEGSLVQLRAQLANLQKQYDSMSGMERMGEAGEALQKKIKSLHDEVLGLEGATGRMQRNVGNYPAAVQPLVEQLNKLNQQMEEMQKNGKQDTTAFAALEKSAQALESQIAGLVEEAKPLKVQLKEATQELMQMKMRGEENTEQYQQLLEKVGQMKDVMADAQAQIKQMASDTGALNSVLDGAKLAAGGFSAALGVMTLFGDKDSETAKEMAEAQKKLQAAIAVTTGLQAVQNALQKESAVMMGIAKLQTWAAAKAQDAYTAATGRATIAQRIFNAVAKANPYVLLATVILSVVGAIAAFTAGSKEQEEQIEETNKELKSQAQLVNDLVAAYNSLISASMTAKERELDLMKARGDSTETIRQYEKSLLDAEEAAINSDKIRLQSLVTSYTAIAYVYQQDAANLQELIEKRATLLAQGHRDLVEMIDADIDALHKKMEEEREALDIVDNLNLREINLNIKRQQYENRIREEDKVAEERAAEEARRRYEERMRQLRQENAALAETINSLKQIHLAEKDAEEQNAKLAESIQAVIDHVGLMGEAIEDLPRPQDIPLLSDDGLPADRTSPLELFAESYRENAQTIMETSSALESAFSTLSSMYQQMAKDETKTEAQRAAAARRAKAWSALQIAANSGTAMAKGIAAAMDTPFPANLAALASTMATLLSAIAQAKALASQTFETGGVIGGYHGASMGHDNTVASVRTGEMVINAKQQKRLYDIANGSASSNLTASLVEALQAMPAPVLVYSELKRFENNVNILDKLSNLD